ncbi:MAG: hypothetical protein KAU17_15470 [Spirochaetales bacterium]|nr:hypothetical protein [Spirochaetales bacterium]
MNRKAVIVLLMFLPLWNLSGEEGPFAILQRGPTPIKGIEYLSPNVLPAHSGEYFFLENTIRVVFTNEFIPLMEAWVPWTCRRRIIYQLPVESSSQGVERLFHCYRSVDEWCIFFDFSDDFGQECRFIEAFLNRFEFFMGLNRDPWEIPFPAILEAP